MTLSFAVDLLKLDQRDLRFPLDLVAMMKQYKSENLADKDWSMDFSG